MAVNDVYRCIFCCYTPDQISLNIMYWKVVGETGSGAQPKDIATALDTTFHAAYKGVMPNEGRWRGVGVQKVQPAPPPVISPSVVNDGTGTSAGDLIPAQVSCLCATKTAVSSRHNRGRIYVGLVSDLFKDNTGFLTTGGVAVLTTLSNLLTSVPVATTAAPAGTSDLQLQIRAKIAGVVSFTNVVTATARTRFATQRRRGQYGRQNPLPF